MTTVAPSTAPGSPTASPTPVAPVLPAAARVDSPAGAEAFARFWITALDYASRSGDTTLIRRLADCAGCNALADGIDKLQTEGGRTNGGAVRIVGSSIVRHVPNEAGLVDLTYDRQARTVVQSTGKEQSVPAEKNVRLLITLKRVGDSWQITNAQPAE